MLNSHIQAINTSSPSKGLNLKIVEELRLRKTNAEMADTTRMGEEIEKRLYGKSDEDTFEKRKAGPNEIAISNNKNSTPLEDVYSSEWWSYLRSEVRAHWNRKQIRAVA